MRSHVGLWVTLEKILNNISFGFHAKDYGGLITSDYSTSRGKISDVLIKSARKLGNKEKGSKGLASVKKYSRGLPLITHRSPKTARGLDECMLYFKEKDIFSNYMLQLTA